MLANFFRKLVDYTPKFAEYFWKLFYNSAARIFSKKNNWKFMNYGYAELNTNTNNYDLLSIQMYSHLVNQIIINPQNEILEIGSGRGGGCEFLLNYNPKEITGLDFSSQAIRFCKRNYVNPKLKFITGNAEKLPFPNESFDTIINIESSHCYGNRLKFFQEVYRCLKPNGYFLYADFMSTNHYPKRKPQLISVGFDVESEQDITKNVLKSMDLSVPYKEKILKQIPFKFLRKSLVDFAGLPNSDIYQKFQTNKSIYFSFICKKQVLQNRTI